jgi:hypothetical protein
MTVLSSFLIRFNLKDSTTRFFTVGFFLFTVNSLIYSRLSLPHWFKPHALVRGASTPKASDTLPGDEK